MRNNNHQREFVRKKEKEKRKETQLKLEKRRGPKIRILCARSRYHIEITREALSFPNINAVFALREKREREGQREREFSHNYPQLSFDAGSGIYTRIFKKKICPLSSVTQSRRIYNSASKLSKWTTFRIREGRAG